MKTLFALLLVGLTSFGGSKMSAEGNLSGSRVIVLTCANLPAPAVGGQFFLEYDTTRMSFVSAAPGDAPFTRTIHLSVDRERGTIDYAVGIEDGSEGTAKDSVYARFLFERTKAACGNSFHVRWRTGPNGAQNMLSSDLAEPILLNQSSKAACE